MSGMTIEKMRTGVDGLFRAFNDHDVDAILAQFTEDVVWEDASLPAPVVGREAVGQLLRGLFTALPDMHFPKEEIVIYTGSSGAASKWHMVATMTGRLDPPGYLPTGKTADCIGMCAYEFRGGLISRHTLVMDVASFSQKLGLMPSEASLVGRGMIGVQNLFTWLTRALKR